MVQETINILGKDVTFGYCYAVELSFKTLAEEDIHSFIPVAIKTVSEDKRLPDIQRCVYLILASMLAYYESKGEKAPIEDKDLMFNCSAEELGLALGTVIKLYSQNFDRLSEVFKPYALQLGVLEFVVACRDILGD